MNYKMKSILVGTMAVALSACASTSQQLESKVGKPILSALAKSEKVSVVRLASQKQHYPVTKTTRELNKEEVAQLRQLLLNDNNYSFDRIKRCLFIPNATYHFSGEKNIDVVVSFSCAKIKIITDKKTTYIDYDPMADKFNTFSHTLLNPTTTS